MSAGTGNITASRMQPEILAPAGDCDCFFAALAAGADGIYLGLKNFSARMEAENFGLAELARLVELAAQNNCRVYVAMNSMLREPELAQAYRLVRRLATQVRPAGLIVQDLAMLAISRQAGFDGLVALSTLANVCDQAGLATARQLGANRVIIPRELSLDEMKMMGAACPDGLELECFVHGALCYCVSGRCYWSSYLGGKSGLRGRCVQPCRRLYGRLRKPGSARQPAKPEAGQRLFSCQDLELLPVVRQLLSVPHLVSWKIEGRKKGPHYVYHAVTAYKILRDEGEDSQQRKLAQEILEMALGRPGGRARFLPQRVYKPMAPHGQTGSGLLAGKIQIQQDGSCGLRPHIDLLPRDFLRIGTEDEKWHATMRVSRMAPHGSAVPLKLQKHKTPRNGTPVYLIDRREPELQAILKKWRAKFEQIPAVTITAIEDLPVLPAKARRVAIPDMVVSPSLAPGKTANPGRAMRALWLTRQTAGVSRTLYRRIFFWLPPAIWPDAEQSAAGMIARLWQAGCRQFVCNTPWQRSYFPEQIGEDAKLVAGPFCNLANALALQEIATLGFCAAFVSPELAAGDMLELPGLSPIALGVVLGGFWPVGMSRFGLTGIDNGDVFASPKGEHFWTRERMGMSWIYPAWPLDLGAKRRQLAEAGYGFFAWLQETAPQGARAGDRPGLFNWEGALL